LSEAQISYTGDGPNDNATRQGLITRILDLIF
jgi:flagellar basal body L-ring protein FlgH